MQEHIGGNLLNTLALEEHDGVNNAHRVNIVAGSLSGGQVTVSLSGNVTLSDSKGFIGLVTVGGGTIGATFSGNVTLDPGSITQVRGNLTISDSKSYIGLVSVGGGVLNTVTAVTDITNPVALKGNLTISDSKGFLGLVTVVQSSSARSIVGNVTLDAGSRTGILGNVTLSDSKNFIGLVTVVQSSSARSIVGNVTLDVGSLVGIRGNLTLSDSKSFIGLVSIGGGILNTVTAVTDVTNPIAIKGNLTLSDSKTFIGLVTAVSQNAGTNKTLLPITVGLGNNSLSTVAVPTNANTIKVTSILLSSNATTEIVIKSGVSYLYGNASIGITLYPGGGFVLPGSPDSPSILGMPSGSLNLEKRDTGGIVSKVSGGIVYFQE